MDRIEYRNTKDYKKAIDILCDFISEALSGDINGLKNNDITLLIRRVDNGKKQNVYFGDINDPDMYYITRAIYIVVWGYVFNLDFDNLGQWGRIIKHPFRGDTMNSFNSVFGKEMIIAKRYCLSDDLIKKIMEYYHLYHSIGNFIVIPNKLNLNSKRANYCTLQDFFDSFLGAMYQYKHPEESTVYRDFCNELEVVFKENDAIEKLSFNDYVNEFYLKSYIRDEKPYDVFNVPLDIRKKEYIGRNRRSKSFYTNDEYISMTSNYLNEAEKIIKNRADSIVERLNEEIGAFNNAGHC